MDAPTLQRWVETISLRDFGKPFRHHAQFNSRLRTTGGRYFLSDHRIEISPRHLQILGREIMDRIIRHELCHYHLHIEGKGYHHRDADFKDLLARVGGLRHTPPLPGIKSKRKGARYVLTCQNCGQEAFRQRKMDPNRYRCGACHGPLSLREI
ncbi:SprT family protein [Marininema mesophilum]|nr:SprT family protein [Marininema mesophilum]